ncbi:MAG: GNAT family N-acetyltransferase [Oribacterium sp.]
MEYRISENKIELLAEDGSILAELDFPDYDRTGKTVEVVHTYVDERLRGQGVAGMLMKKLVRELRRTDRRAKLSCSYAVQWFERHREERELLSDE